MRWTLHDAIVLVAAMVFGFALAGRAGGETFVLENDRLAIAWQAEGGRLVPEKITGKLSGQTLLQAGAALFRLTLEDASGAARTVAASDLELVAPPAWTDVAARADAVRAGDRLAGRALAATFRERADGVTVEWRALLREGAHYVRTWVTVRGGVSAVRLRRVELLDIRGPGAVQAGSVPGSPVVLGPMFFGMELPFATNAVEAEGFRSACDCNLPLAADRPYTFSAVVGAAADGQLRRGFSQYLDQERAVPYHPFLHYNCWYDLERRINEKDVLAAIAAFSRELTERRGVAMDSFVLDDGWDDPQEGFWAVSRAKFPSGFAPLSAALEREGSHLGIWISPLAGYSGAQERVDQARKLGLVRGKWLDLSEPEYYAWFRDECAGLMREHRVNYFKWDKAGEGVSPHFMALLACAEELRQIDPRLFLNVTVGTWPSPFWLALIDSTWRNGDDMGWQGKGDERERWITYRDGQTYRNVVRRAPLYPIHSLMTGGIVLADGHPFAARAAKAGNNLRHEARSFFGMGTNLQELYIQHDMMDSRAWDDVAAGALWARRNADALVDSHWIGGDPNALEPYGFAAWSPRKAVVTLRNPDDRPREIALDAAAIFELPEGAPQRYALSEAYGEPSVPRRVLEAGRKTAVPLAPFEVLVFDAVPAK